MDKLSKLNDEICLLRLKLEKIILSGDLKDSEVLKLSEKLDSLIIKYYAEKNGTSS